jgi:hypothetical protein
MTTVLALQKLKTPSSTSLRALSITSSGSNCCNGKLQ